MRLLGIYNGVPLPAWGRGRAVRPPDLIRIFRLPVLQALRPGEDARDRIRKVVLHELGHRAGLGEDRLRDLGVY